MMYYLYVVLKVSHYPICCRLYLNDSWISHFPANTTRRERDSSSFSLLPTPQRSVAEGPCVSLAADVSGTCASVHFSLVLRGDTAERVSAFLQSFTVPMVRAIPHSPGLALPAWHGRASLALCTKQEHIQEHILKPGWLRSIVLCAWFIG